MTAPSRPIPVPDEITQEFWDAVREHRLVIQHCSSCSRFNHTPSLTCRSCGGAELSYREVSGRGTVHSYTVIEHPPGPGFADLVPFVIVIVELAEQPRLFLTADLLGVAPADIRLGMDVEVTFEEIGEGCTLPQFRPAGE
ncbi:hypothetical protein FPZ12_044330 [Amycolatopsis acidicola]|uniref:Zn-ribbon domain-containing OB-fold protein n=1 Tax=Amycolatopsis acidicola TaxID=2596893 RepID=A0A5N0UM37_9PSEU|nr:OB-fold domain-containing protein [Amycolatopsis acidicola]KAA9148870.1 hypothetical protein FPZ12_044330 [Amycolatopsis acidicola]